MSTDTAGAALLERLVRRTRGAPSALALVEASGWTVLSHDCDAGSDFEIGSISKGVTGLLYRDAVDRGEVLPGTRLDALLPLSRSPAGAIVLADLATHRSGLPRLLLRSPLRATAAYYLHDRNPYDEPLVDLYAAARRARLRPGRARYSNGGFQLLGHALAAAAGTSYPDLVRTRLAEPLGLQPWYLPDSPGELLPSALPGHRGRRTVAPWTGAAVAPAGGIRASIDAMAALTRRLLMAGVADRDDTPAAADPIPLPGATALEPVAEFLGPNLRIGAGWLTSAPGGFGGLPPATVRTPEAAPVGQRPDRAAGLLTWHNGGTGGFRSWLGVRRDVGIGAVVLTACTRSVDAIGRAAVQEWAPTS